MREHDQAAPPDDGGHQGSYTTPSQTSVASNVNARPAQNVPIPTTGSAATDVSTRPVSLFSSQWIWWSLAVLLAVSVLYMFLAPSADRPQQSAPLEAPMQR